MDELHDGLDIQINNVGIKQFEISNMNNFFVFLLILISIILFQIIFILADRMYHISCDYFNNQNSEPINQNDFTL